MNDIAERLQAIGVGGVRIPPVSISAGYRLVITFGAFVAALFPLAYVGSIVLAGWGTYILAGRLSPIGSWFTLLAGALLVLSLVKPLVAKSVPLPRPHALEAGREPLLFAFVHAIASAGAMPEPSGIAVDCSVNSYCEFAGGVKGLFDSGFDLVVGLPIVAGFRTGQFAGVVAHELCHAAQMVKMRASRLLWGVSAWFSRVVNQRDEIDGKILAWLAAPSRAARYAAHLARMTVLPGRGVLRILKFAENAAVGVILRRMDLEASRCQMRVAGSDGFDSTISELNLLSLAAQRAVVELGRMKRRRQLVVNYPGLIASIRRSYSEEFAGRMLASLEHGKTSFLAAHPGDRDGIALARAEAERGMVTAALPASELFANFDALCREVTLEYYQQEFGITPEGCELC